MSGYLTFDSTNLLTAYGLRISGEGTFDAPEASVTKMEVPGRNGDLVFDNGRYNNITVTYPGFIISETLAGFDTKISGLRNYLTSRHGYYKVVDSYHSGEYRLGRFISPLAPTVDGSRMVCSVNLAFDCDPRRWLDTGDTTTTRTASGTISNPTGYDSKPILEINGAGQVTLNGTTITIASHSYTSIIIDCELMDCYSGSDNCNSYVTLTEFPTLSPGSNALTIGTGITQVKITPKWWTL